MVKTFSLSDDAIAAITELAVRMRCSRSKAVELAVRALLERTPATMGARTIDVSATRPQQAIAAELVRELGRDVLERCANVVAARASSGASLVGWSPNDDVVKILAERVSFTARDGRTRLMLAAAPPAWVVEALLRGTLAISAQ